MNKTGGRAARRTREQWSKILEQYGESAQTQAAFCVAHDLTISSFTRALRRAREGGIDVTVTNAFVPVMVDSVAPLTPSSAWDVELTLGAGIVLRIRGV